MSFTPLKGKINLNFISKFHFFFTGKKKIVLPLEGAAVYYCIGNVRLYIVYCLLCIVYFMLYTLIIYFALYIIYNIV